MAKKKGKKKSTAKKKRKILYGRIFNSIILRPFIILHCDVCP